MILSYTGKSKLGVKVIIPPNSPSDRVTVAEQQNVMLQCLLPTSPQYFWWKCALGQCKKLSGTGEFHTIYSVKQSDAGNYFCGGQDKSSWSEAVEVVINRRLYETVTPSTSSNTVASHRVPTLTVSQQWTSTKSKIDPTAQGTDLSKYITDNHQQTAFTSTAGSRRQKLQPISAKSPVATTSKRSDLSVTDGEQPSKNT